MKMPPLNAAFAAFSLLILFATVYVAIDSILAEAVHPLYSGISLVMAILAAIVVFLISAMPSIVPQITSALLSAFYAQRIVVTYFAPDSLDYHEYNNFTLDQLNYSIAFYLISVLSIFCGFVLARLTIRTASPLSDEIKFNRYKNINYFYYRVDFRGFARISIYAAIMLAFITIYYGLQGVGIAGATYESDAFVEMRFAGLYNVYIGLILFCVIFYQKDDLIYRWAIFAFVLIFAISLLNGGKGFLMSLILAALLNYRLLDKPVSPKFIYLVIFIVIFSIVIFFPLMTSVRGYVLSGFDTFDFFGDYDLTKSLKLFSSRLGGFDWMNLWISIPATMIPASNTSVITEFAILINSLVPGEIIEVPELVQLSKLMVVYGRGYGDILELGGHAENVGGLGTAFIYFGFFGAQIYLFLISLFLGRVEVSNLHSFHKQLIINNSLILFLVGGGFVLIQGTIFTALVIYALQAFIIASGISFFRYMQSSSANRPARGKAT